MSKKCPKPTHWHVAPKGAKRCPVCDAPARLVRRCEHRATTPSDDTDAHWLKRNPARGFKVVPVGHPRARKKPSRPRQSGPTRETTCTIAKAALLMASGQSIAQAADVLGINRSSLYRLHEHYGDLFQREYEAMKARFNALAAEAVGDGEDNAANSWAVMLLEIKQRHAELNGRILTEDSAELPPLSPQMTLTEFFHAYAWPFSLQAKGDTDRTRADYLTSLRYWTQLTGDPPINQVSKQTCSTFLQLLRELPGVAGGKLSPNTIHKHWVNVQRLLAWTGPADRHNPSGANLIATPPWLPSPRRHRQPPRPGIALSDIWQWLEVLPAHAKWMPKLGMTNPVAWWRAVILTFYNTGLRPGTLFGITWEMIDGHRLMVPPAISKGHQGRLLWLNDAALDALQPLRRSTGLVFRWSDWPAAETTLKKHRVAQQRAAGIPPRSFYSFRRTFATECGKISPIAMQIQMGHVGPGLQMAADHYIDAEAVLAEALSKLPQPTPPTDPQQNAA